MITVYIERLVHSQGHIIMVIRSINGVHNHRISSQGFQVKFAPNSVPSLCFEISDKIVYETSDYPLVHSFHGLLEKRQIEMPTASKIMQ